MRAFLLFQHHLVPALPESFDRVLLVEDPHLAGLVGSIPVAFSGVRVAYDLACCRQYVVDHPSVQFFPAELSDDFYSNTLPTFESVTVFHPHDRDLLRFLEQWSRRRRIPLEVLPSPLFLLRPDPQVRYRLLHPFYVRARKTLGLLVDAEGKPEGGRWSFDADNREPFRGDPRRIPVRPSLPRADLRQLQRAYRERRETPFWNHAPHRVWPAQPEWLAPVSRAGALRWLRHFVEERLVNFGRYQDAMLAADGTRLFHAILSPLLNRGLLLPGEVLDAVLAARDIPLPSKEGFVRQLIGWREYALHIYENVAPIPAAVYRRGRRLRPAWYTAATGLAPLDDVLARYWRSGYAHHIERLMVIGNAMLLCDVAPIEAYRWFMEASLDSYPWVMDLNVRMILFLGNVTSKPYGSSSRYLRRQSDYPAGSWTDAWDALYTAYILRHAPALRSVRDMAMIVRAIENMSPAERRRRQILARATIDTLTVAK